MRLSPAAAALSIALSAVPARADAPEPGTSVAWDIVTGLTTDVGQRLAGSEAEARARAWALARLRALGFTNVREEPFTITGYVRGTDAAAIVAPIPHVLAVTALGYSAPTPAGGITADVAYFATLDALKAAPAGSLAGRIAFVDHAMRANQDGSGYGPYGDVRRKGPGIASDKGAAAIVIRSVGTDHHRNPHTGAIAWATARPIPAAAVSNADADLIARIVAGGKPLRLMLASSGHAQDGLPSGNVIADLPGRDPRLPPILIGCHLDSWDLAEGAIDDASGCAIVTAAALRAQGDEKRAGKGKGKARARLLRTVRVLWAGSEELGGFGGIAYAKAHTAEPHALVMESDTGADRVWNVKLALAAANKPLADAIVAALNPLGIVPGKGVPFGGTDVEPIALAQKAAVIDLSQDATRYFDLHHTPDDTIDKVDPDLLEQNVAAWTAVLRIVGNEPGAIAGS